MLGPNLCQLETIPGPIWEPTETSLECFNSAALSPLWAKAGETWKRKRKGRRLARAFEMVSEKMQHLHHREAAGLKSEGNDPLNALLLCSRSK